jgi:hypothetical protein
LKREFSYRTNIIVSAPHTSITRLLLEKAHNVDGVLKIMHYELLTVLDTPNYIYNRHYYAKYYLFLGRMMQLSQVEISP